MKFQGVRGGGKIRSKDVWHRKKILGEGQNCERAKRLSSEKKKSEWDGGRGRGKMCWEDICEKANDRVPKMKFEGGGDMCSKDISHRKK